MDLLSVLPDFSTKSYAHILPPIERSKITTVDLITLDTLEIAKRAHVPPADVRRLSAQITEALHADLGFEKGRTDIGSLSDAEPSSSIRPDSVTVAPVPTTKLQTSRWNTISTLDPAMDELLGGGIPMGYVTEVTGERYVLESMGLEIQDTALTFSQFLSTVEVARPNCSSASFWLPSWLNGVAYHHRPYTSRPNTLSQLIASLKCSNPTHIYPASPPTRRRPSRTYWLSTRWTWRPKTTSSTTSFPSL
jgi:hypothetical protein